MNAPSPSPLFNGLPVAYDAAEAKRSRVPVWVEKEGVMFLHDPERPDRLDDFSGHEWSLE